MTQNTGSDAVLCAGRVYCDLVFTGVASLPVEGTETFSDNVSLHAGGGAFITAAAFSALGWKTALLATLPAAPFDAIVSRDIAEFGLDTAYCAPARTGAAPQITVAIAGKDDRAFLTHKVDTALPDADFPKGAFRHLHIGELRSLIEHPNLIEKARHAGMTISVDCSWDADLLERGAEMADFLSRVDVFLPNKTEYDLLTASGLPAGAAPLTVVKCGRDGARAFDRHQWIFDPALSAKVVDTTGAGDAFNGGFLSGWLAGKPLEASLAKGNLWGRSAVEKVGGTGGLRILQTELAVAPSAAASTIRR